jgi:hypothetical protein
VFALLKIPEYPFDTAYWQGMGLFILTTCISVLCRFAISKAASAAHAVLLRPRIAGPISLVPIWREAVFARSLPTVVACVPTPDFSVFDG